MKFSIWKGLPATAVLAAASILSACGGGGGSGGESTQSYDITLRAQTVDGVEQTTLPANTTGVQPSVGGLYTLTLYVELDTGGRPIPSGDFACVILDGLDSGALYLIDGTDTEDDDGNIQGYRSVTLSSNSGVASFHLHAFSKPGTVRIRCTFADNGDQTAEKSIQVI